MSFWTILDTLLFKPLQLLFEVIYLLANRIIENPGASIIVLSLLMNFLVLPLYKRADAMQEEEKAMERRLRDGVRHIKKTFKGDEKMMILQTYYRQNHYKPTYVLRGAVSLMLEIPFFIAAYRFLSGLALLQGASFGPIADLGQPDALLTIGTLHVNLLPFLMTGVNLISCVIFTKDSPLKTKIQLYAMALFFLVFLYSSPAGLVFYWTLNNVFSLVKTIFYKLKHSDRILAVLASAAGLAALLYGLFLQSMPTPRRIVFFAACGVLLQLPLLRMLLKDRLRKPALFAGQTGKTAVFLTGALALAVLTGLLIPSAVISSSPQEFVDVNLFRHPAWYLVSACALSLGTFVVWLGVFYWLAKPQTRALFDRAVWVLCGVFLVDYLCFGRNLGNLSAGLVFDDGVSYTLAQQLLNLGVLALAAAALLVLFRFCKKHAVQVLAVVLAAFIGMSGYNIVKINRSVAGLSSRPIELQDDKPLFTLSKTGKNVIFLMLDRGINEYIPYLFQEKPELQEQFQGFTYYKDVLSFGGSTNFGTPALFGGYEYTPYELNKRNTERLATKQNEALRVLPVLFDRSGYDVTVCDPVYANYSWYSDTSIYNPYPDIHAYVTKGAFSDSGTKVQQIKQNDRNFFCYSLLKVAPLCLQPTIYDKGNYIQAESSAVERKGYLRQTTSGNYTATGIYSTFMDAYSVLVNLPGMTKITEQKNDTFLMMVNDTPHEAMMLQEPEYAPKYNVDNSKYEREHADRYTYDGVTLHMEQPTQFMHYQVNMATMLQLGKWFDYLRENGVWDNTRIILAADHGRYLYHLDSLILDDNTDLERFYPLLMVKDFGSTEFTTSSEFMTNADVPTIATQGLLENPVNPFTGNRISSDAKQGPLYVLDSQIWNTNENNGNTYLPGRWFLVKDSMLDKNNWTVVAENATLPVKD